MSASALRKGVGGSPVGALDRGSEAGTAVFVPQVTHGHQGLPGLRKGSWAGERLRYCTCSGPAELFSVPQSKVMMPEMEWWVALAVKVGQVLGRMR